MSAKQTTYALDREASFEGMLHDTRDVLIIGMKNDSGGELAYGKVVCQSASDSNFMIEAADGAVVAGVLVHSHDEEKNETGLSDDAYGNVLQRGIVWVRVEEAVTIDDTPMVRLVASVDYGVGSILVTADPLNTAPLSGMRFMRSADADELVPMYVNLSAPIVLVEEPEP